MSVLRWTEEQFAERQAAAARLQAQLPARQVAGVLSAPDGVSHRKLKKAKPGKYGAQKTIAPGQIRFDSKLEAREYAKLELRQKAGEIRKLDRQVRFSLFGPHGIHIQIYKADFTFEERTAEGWQFVVADAKSDYTKTLRTWSKIKTLMRACHGHDVRELP